jgi:3-deoxy-manno-octulosonate cytidylyltransferase (CMP-KDO synthetase)
VQLRLIEAGIGIGTFPVEGESLSVDTAEQLEQARAMAASISASSSPLGIGS